MCVGACRSENKVLASLELKLQVGSEMSDVGAGNQTQDSTPLQASKVLTTTVDYRRSDSCYPR